MNAIPDLRSQCLKPSDMPVSRSQPESDEIFRLEALRAEVQAAREVLHAELAAVAPILGDIFKEWPDAQITRVVDGLPPAEQRTIVPEKPPSSEAVERRAQELLAQAEQNLGVTISDRVKALDCFRARAIAELSAFGVLFPMRTSVIGAN